MPSRQLVWKVSRGLVHILRKLAWRGLLAAIKAAGVEGEQWLVAHIYVYENSMAGSELLWYFACQGSVMCWPSSRGAWSCPMLWRSSGCCGAASAVQGRCSTLPCWRKRGQAALGLPVVYTRPTQWR